MSEPSNDRADARASEAPAGPPEPVPGEAPPAVLVECPECGAPATAAAVETWGNCRACRTAQSRTTHPLRW
jgi:hypothetical protein